MYYISQEVKNQSNENYSHDELWEYLEYLPHFVAPG